MSNSYGRRAEDIMIPSDMTSEVISNLTDSQKINVKLIQNLTSLNTSLNDVKHDVSVHDRILVTGNGTPSLQERLRLLEKFVDSFQYWLRFVGGAIVLQTLAFFIGAIIALVKLVPLLDKLANQP